MRKIPSSVYRIQITEKFPLKKAASLIPYLHDLGIEGVYCSPLYECFQDGYNVSNPTRLNPGFGTAKDFEEFCAALKKHNMKFLFDVVSNHMSIKGDRNVWWNDVLKHGKASKYADYFDIENVEKIDLPILQKPYRESLKEIRMEGNSIRYGDYILPLNCEPKGSLDEILEKQFYHFRYWKEPCSYRRFFNYNDLIALRMEKEKVFKDHHEWVFQLLRQDKIQGLRIDHCDGFYDPEQYFERIQKHKPPLLIVEKILSTGELLRQNWKVDGSVGYDCLNLLGGLFIHQKNKRQLTQIYRRFEKKDFQAFYYEQRKTFILKSMPHEIGMLSKDPDLTKAIIETMACMPVYRTYVKKSASALDRKIIAYAIREAKKKIKLKPAVFTQLQSMLLSPSEFTFRFQQFTASVLARGLEDSTFYLYNRLISLNEVGGDPTRFGTTKRAFHAYNKQKLKKWPFGLLASSTHDSKYSEDVRMRIHTFTEMLPKWEPSKEIDPNTQFLIHQILAGLQTKDMKRLWPCIQIAIRHAGIHTSWLNIDLDYEERVKTFVSQQKNKPFSEDIDRCGKLNSLSALVLKIGSCGIVDIYQGNEWFNYCLMDPDNRRPIDYTLPKDEKWRMTQKALQFRRNNKELFLKGDYIPLRTLPHVIAFMRRLGNQTVFIIAGRFFTKKKKIGTLSLPKEFDGKILQDLFTQQPIRVQKRKIELFSSATILIYKKKDG